MNFRQNVQILHNLCTKQFYLNNSYQEDYWNKNNYDLPFSSYNYALTTFEYEKFTNISMVIFDLILIL